MRVFERKLILSLAFGGIAVACGPVRCWSQSAPAKGGGGAGTNATAVAGRILGAPVAPPPAYARFHITFSWADPKAFEKERGGPPPPLIVRSIDYLKGPRVGRMISTYKDGGTKTMWWYNRITLEKYASGTDIILTDAPTEGREGMAADDTDLIEIWLTKYPGFEWVRPEHYAGEEMRNGFPCLHFVKAKKAVRRRFRYNAEIDDEGREIPAPPGVITNAAGQVISDMGEIESQVPGSEAWVTVEGRWPVQARHGDVLWTYKHMEPPTAQSFPRMEPAFEQELVSYCKAWGLPVPKY